MTTAIACLVALGAVPEIERLLPLLNEPPGITWAVHIQLLDGLRMLGLPAPELDHLAAVDNLDLVRSVVALRCAPRFPDATQTGKMTLPGVRAVDDREGSVVRAEPSV